MIYLLHGPDIVSSRAFLLKLKSQFPSAETIDPKIIEKHQDILSAQNLFEKERLLVIENWFPKETKNFPIPKDTNIVFWLKDIIQPPTWVDKSIPFKLPDQVSGFKLADATFYGQEKQALLLMEKLLLENTASELIIGAFTRQLRLLTLGLEGEWDKVSKSSFLQDKIKDQLKNWNRKKLKAASLVLLKTDWDIKSGNLGRNESLLSLVSKICNLAKPT